RHRFGRRRDLLSGPRNGISSPHGTQHRRHARGSRTRGARRRQFSGSTRPARPHPGGVDRSAPRTLPRLGGAPYTSARVALLTTMVTSPKPRRLSFYRRLSAAQKREYDRSDARPTLPLVPVPALAEAAGEVVAAIGTESPAKVRRAAQRLVDEICTGLSARSGRRVPPPPRVRVLRTRPRVARSEFHGLYTRFDNGESEIKVWMFTAAHRHVVKARTFLRTLLHEVCHHVD